MKELAQLFCLLLILVSATLTPSQVAEALVTPSLQITSSLAMSVPTTTTTAATTTTKKMARPPACGIDVSVATCQAAAPISFVYDSLTAPTVVPMGSTTAAGTCACEAGLTATITPPSSGNLFDYSNEFVAEVDCSSNNITTFCACDSLGNCYETFGKAVSPSFFIGPLCDYSVCGAYLVFQCTSADSTSGLVNMATGAQVTCAQIHKSYQFGPGFPYPVIASISCNQCIKCATCNGPFTPSMVTDPLDESDTKKIECD